MVKLLDQMHFSDIHREQVSLLVIFFGICKINILTSWSWMVGNKLDVQTNIPSTLESQQNHKVHQYNIKLFY